MSDNGSAANNLTLAMIGDMVHSKKLGDNRYIAQKEFYESLSVLNDEFSDAILAKFIITTGDEFQGLLRTASVLPDLIFRLESTFKRSAIRLGFGYGNLATPLQEYAIGSDGPVWYNARQAIIQAKKENLMGGYYVGFGEESDIILNGISRIAYFYRNSLTVRQRNIINLMNQGLKQNQAAESLGVSPQAISNSIQASGWFAYCELTAAWTCALKRFDLD